MFRKKKKKKKKKTFIQLHVAVRGQCYGASDFPRPEQVLSASSGWNRDTKFGGFFSRSHVLIFNFYTLIFLLVL